MNGIDILSSAEVVTKYTFNWQIFWITALIITALITLMGIVTYIDTNYRTNVIPFCVISGVIISIMLGGAFGMILNIPIEYITEYKVIVSDEVNFNEFQEKYEIINQEGKIYTVREKDEM